MKNEGLVGIGDTPERRKKGLFSGIDIYAILVRKGYSESIAIETCKEMGMDFEPQGGTPVVRPPVNIEQISQGRRRES